MTSPKRVRHRSLAPIVHNLDWDSPSFKTGTVKRRPNSCGDPTKMTVFEDQEEIDLIIPGKTSLGSNGLELKPIKYLHEDSGVVGVLRDPKVEMNRVTEGLLYPVLRKEGTYIIESASKQHKNEESIMIDEGKVDLIENTEETMAIESIKACEQFKIVGPQKIESCPQIMCPEKALKFHQDGKAIDEGVIDLLDRVIGKTETTLVDQRKDCPNTIKENLRREERFDVDDELLAQSISKEESVEQKPKNEYIEVHEVLEPKFVISKDIYDKVNCLKEATLKEERLQKLYLNIEAFEVPEIRSPRLERPSFFCSGISQEDHKFTINKCGKVKPDRATLFSPSDKNISEMDRLFPKLKTSKLKTPDALKGNRKFLAKSNANPVIDKSKAIVRKGAGLRNDDTNEKCVSNGAKVKICVPKLSLSFLQPRTNIRIFSGKGNSKSNPPKNKETKMQAKKKAVGNEYVKINRGKKYSKSVSISKLPSKIPKTPIEGEAKALNLSPNKKYTVTSQNGVRCDKDNYYFFDPKSDFGNTKSYGNKNDKRKTVKVDSISQNDKEGSKFTSKNKFGVDRKIANNLKETDDEYGFESFKPIDEMWNKSSRKNSANETIVGYGKGLSDTDSGILSPMSPFDVGCDLERRNSKTSPLYARLRIPGYRPLSGDYGKIFKISGSKVNEEDEDVKPQVDEQQKIYTDWANHYLERGRSARRVRRLAECADAELLRDLLEAVTGQRVPAARQCDLLTSCLQFLHALRVPGIEHVSAQELREGRLKAVLALLFALSRHKQSHKHQQPQNQHVTSTKPESPYSSSRMTGGAACEDLVSAAMLQNRQASRSAAAAGTAIPLPRRARPLPPTPGGGGSGKAASASSSRSSSPGGNSRSSNLQCTPQNQGNQHGSRPNSSLIAPGSKIPASPYSTQLASPGAPTPPPHQTQPQTKHSMLDKLKLFKDKSSDRHRNSPAISKRTSSSSGFSSAKSERSDSSLSLNEAHTNQHIKTPNNINYKQPQSEVNTMTNKTEQKISSKSLKSKLATSKPQKEANVNQKQPKPEKASKNSPKLQQKEVKTVPVVKTVNSKGVQVVDDALKSSAVNKLPVKPQDTKISRLSGSQMKLTLSQDPRIAPEQNKLSPVECKTVPVSNIQQPKVVQNNVIPNSNSNTSFASNPNMAQGQNSTGIPKPTAAVKGTSKIPKDDKANLNVTKSSNSATQMSTSQSNSTLMTNSVNSNNALPFNRELSSLTKENCQKQTLIVSPMPNNANIETASAITANPNLSSQMSESSNSNSTHSASTGQNSNSSEGSVIYRPSSESGSEMSKARHTPVIPNRKIDTNQFITEPDKLYKNENGVEMRATKERKTNKDSFERIPEMLRVSDTTNHGRDNSLGDEENPSMNVLPMRPLLRGYNSHLTLPARTSNPISAKNLQPQGYSNTVKANFGRENLVNGYNLNRNGQYVTGYMSSEYCDLDIAAGYMSEGDCLRRLGAGDRGRDLEKERMKMRQVGDGLDGYMSEGGASLYGRKMQYAAYQPSLQQFDERCGQQTSPHPRGALPARPLEQQGTPGRPGQEQNTPGRPGMEAQQQRAGAARNGRKSDSGQQTDAYKIVSSNGHGSKNGDNQWKKYTDSPGVGSPVQGGGSTSPLGSRRRAPSQQQGRKPQQGERLTAAQQLQTTAPPPQQMHYNMLNTGHHSSKTGPGGQLQSPGSVSSQSSSRCNGVSSSGSQACGGAGGPSAPCPSPQGGARVKGVPQSFGYVKRAGAGQQNMQQMQQGGRTAQVSAVPRTKLKISGGTQTCTQDLQIHKGGSGVKSFSLSGSAASQLSQSVRERLLMGSQSLPKPGSHDFNLLFQHHRVPPRGGMKINDGSLSDTQTYSDVKSDYGSPYSSWLRHSNTYSASGRLSECDSMESLQSLQPSGSSRAPPRLTQQPRLNRSNSIRSTKSEKLYPSMLQRSSEGEYEPYYCLPVNYGNGQGLSYGTSEPPSPSPGSALSPGAPSAVGGPISPTPGLPPTMQHMHMNKTHPTRHSHHYKKNDEGHGSTASLVSTASSLHSSAEERQAHEARKLRRELADARDKVHHLTTQLTTNAHVVSAFEQSLSNMTQRLQQLTATAERKDSELTQLRQTIELLRKQSIQAGLTSAHMTSMGIKQDSVTPTSTKDAGKLPPPSVKSNGSSMSRHLSTDSVNSINSLSSGCSSAQDKKHKKKGWLRSSFTKAFSRNAKISKTSKQASLQQLPQDASPHARSHQEVGSSTIAENSREGSVRGSRELGPGHDTSDANNVSVNGEHTEDESRCDPHIVDELKKQLREKDLVLTDIRLEALSSAHQLESLKDTVIKMRNEMLNLKQNNERLQRLVRPRSLVGSRASLSQGASAAQAQTDSEGRRFSTADAQRTPTQHEMDLHQPLDYHISPTLTDFPGKLSPLSGDAHTAEEHLGQLEQHDGEERCHILTTGRLSGVPCDEMDAVLPAPKCRELAMGESYAELGLTETSADISDGKKIAIAVYLGQPDTFSRYYEEVCETLISCDSRFYSNRSSAAYHHPQDLEINGSPRLSLHQTVPTTPEQDFTSKSNTNSLKSNKSNHSTSYNNNFSNVTESNAPNVNCNEFVIAYTYISGKTTWQNLDYTVRKTFKDYLSRIDPGTNLGLNTDSITSYHLGEATRGPEVNFPELLPCGYIIGTVKTLYICLQGVGSLAFDSLIPKNIVYRYVSLLSEHRRVILCGPSGTGKSYLAARLAEFHVARTAAHLNPAEAIATFNVEHKSSKELRQYLSNLAEQCGSESTLPLPSVLILDNLHHASALADVFSGLCGARRAALPCIIGTMSQAICNTTNLQLHHNFRWLLTANHMEPVKGFLARYLRRKQLVWELGGGPRCPRLSSVLEWLPAVWQHINAFLEAHSSSDVTVGPRLFLTCPLDVQASQAWFTNVWNLSVVPYLTEAAREGVALYGRRGAWADPAKHVRDTYPWPDPQAAQALRGISLEDIGLDGSNADSTTTSNQDPLLNMLMRLQEAANYSGNHSQDSDNASLDSNMTHDSSVGNEA